MRRTISSTPNPVGEASFDSKPAASGTMSVSSFSHKGRLRVACGKRTNDRQAPLYPLEKSTDRLREATPVYKQCMTQHGATA